jgi:uncharacterized protein YcaQ
MFERGDLSGVEIAGVKYVWPAGELKHEAPPPKVRFLAPFDPLVWDRVRFEHLWGWPYRFEAYTPPAKRQMGYYAMPLLWGEQIIGWVNVTRQAGGFQAAAGFVGKKPTDRLFRQAFEAELSALNQFMQH